MTLFQKLVLAFYPLSQTASPLAFGYGEYGFFSPKRFREDPYLARVIALLFLYALESTQVSCYFWSELTSTQKRSSSRWHAKDFVRLTMHGYYWSYYYRVQVYIQLHSNI